MPFQYPSLSPTGTARDVCGSCSVGGRTGIGKVDFNHFLSSPSFPPLPLPPLQGEIIDRIEYNVETAAVHVDKARIALRKAVSLKKSSNRVRSA